MKCNYSVSSREVSTSHTSLGFVFFSFTLYHIDTHTHTVVSFFLWLPACRSSCTREEKTVRLWILLAPTGGCYLPNKANLLHLKRPSAYLCDITVNIMTSRWDLRTGLRLKDAHKLIVFFNCWHHRVELTFYFDFEYLNRDIRWKLCEASQGKKKILFTRQSRRFRWCFLHHSVQWAGCTHIRGRHSWLCVYSVNAGNKASLILEDELPEKRFIIRKVSDLFAITLLLH